MRILDDIKAYISKKTTGNPTHTSCEAREDEETGKAARKGGQEKLLSDFWALTLESITGYPFYKSRVWKEGEEYREEARKKRREKLMSDFEEYREEFRLLRGDVGVIKIRNRQKKYEFDLHIKTEDGTFPIEKIFGSLTKYVASNKKLRWDIEDYMPDEREAKPDFIMKFQDARTVLLEDRRKIDDLLREIRPFIEHPL